MTQRDKVIDRITKNLRMAESARSLGSIHEAEAFAAMAQKMMLKHKVEMSDLEVEALEHEEAVEGEDWSVGKEIGLSDRGRQHWLSYLSAVVADHHFCRILVIPRSKTIFLVGRESDRKVAKYLIGVLARTARQLQRKYLADERRRVMRWERVPASAGRTFLMGFVRAIRERLEAERRRFEQDLRVTNPHAIVRLSQAIAPVEAYARKHQGGGKVRGGDAYRAGYEAGRQVSWSAGVGQSGTAAKVANGPKQLKG